MNPEKLIKELKFTFARSGGAGGQNVNKVETKVIIHFDIDNSRELDNDQKELIKEKLVNKINKVGQLVLSTSEARSQLKNKKIATDKLLSLINQALIIPKKRKKKRRSINAKLMRLQSKKIQSEKKNLRKKPHY